MERLSMSMFASKVDYDAAVAAQTEAKPVVRYLKTGSPFGVPTLRDRCDVIPLDHPVSYLNGKLAHTSEVVNIDANGEDFETLNTRYVLAEKELH